MKEKNKLSIVTDYLEGNAKAWAGLNQKEWSNFEKFKEAFIKQFWSEDAQGEVKFRLSTPKIYNRRYGSYVDHAWHWVAKATYLEPPLTEKQLTGAIIRHYPREIETILVASQAQTVATLIRILERIQTSEYNERPNNWRGGWDHNREEERRGSNNNNSNQDRERRGQEYRREAQPGRRGGSPQVRRSYGVRENLEPERERPLSQSESDVERPQINFNLEN